MSFIDALFPLVIGLLLLACPQKFTKKNLDGPDNADVKRRFRIAGQILLGETQKDLPRQVDEVTILEEVKSEGDTLIYIYTINADIENLEEFRKFQKIENIKILKSYHKKSIFIENNILIKSIYRFKDTGKEVIYTMKPEDYR